MFRLEGSLCVIISLTLVYVDLIQLNKMRLSQTCSEVWIGKYLSDIFLNKMVWNKIFMALACNYD